MIDKRVILQVPLKNGEIYNINLKDIVGEVGKLKNDSSEFVYTIIEEGRNLTVFECFMDNYRIMHERFSIDYEEEPNIRVEVIINFYKEHMKDDELSIIIGDDTYKIYELFVQYCILGGNNGEEYDDIDTYALDDNIFIENCLGNLALNISLDEGIYGEVNDVGV